MAQEFWRCRQSQSFGLKMVKIQRNAGKEENMCQRCCCNCRHGIDDRPYTIDKYGHRIPQERMAEEQKRRREELRWQKPHPPHD